MSHRLRTGLSEIKQAAEEQCFSRRLKTKLRCLAKIAL